MIYMLHMTFVSTPIDRSRLCSTYCRFKQFNSISTTSIKLVKMAISSTLSNNYWIEQKIMEKADKFKEKFYESFEMLKNFESVNGVEIEEFKNKFDILYQQIKDEPSNNKLKEINNL